MPEGHIKCKVISFRVTDDEYETVDAVSQKLGFPSVSLFARSTTLKDDCFEPVRTPLDAELNRLWRRIDALTSALEQITARFGLESDPGKAVDS